MAEQFIVAAEAESFVKGLETFPLKEVGSGRWIRQHENIQKLNLQAFLNATAKQDDFVKDFLVSYGKIPVLVQELILVEVWKQKVLPVLCQLTDFNPGNTFLLSIVMHHEASIMNLLETIMFFKESCEAADESVLDLLDYCLRKLTLLVGKASSNQAVTHDDQHISPMEELKRQDAENEFHLSMKALPVLQYIADHTDNIGVINRMVCTHNLPCVLVQLIVCHPWSRCVEGELQKYIQCKWQKVPPEDQLKITALEAQVWFALYHLLLKPDCQRKYDFNNFNKNQLLKLRGFMTDVLIDQLPNLMHLQRFLAQLAVTDPAPPKKELLLEQIPEMWNHIVTENCGKWEAIAKYQAKETFSPSHNDLKQQAQRLVQLYDFQVMERFFPEKQDCGFCGKEATKKCSRCGLVFYCNKECQTKHWPQHKCNCRNSSKAAETLPQADC